MDSISIEMAGVVILTVVLAGVLVAYDRVLKKLQRLRHEEGKIEEAAQMRAEKVLQEARIKANDIIKQAKMNEEQLQNQLAQMINDADKGHVEEYKQKLRSISDDIETNLQEQVSEFRKVLETETVTAQQAAASKVESQYEEIKKELEDYRQKRMQEIEKDIEEALEAGLKKSMGGMISVEGKRALVMKALEEAKKQNVFELG